MGKWNVMKRFNLIFMADVIYSLHQWLILTLLIKWGTPEGLGAFNYALAVTAPLVMFSWMNGHTMLTAEKAGLANFRLVLRARYTLLVVGALLLSIFFLGFGKPELAWIVVLMYVNKMVESYGNLAYGFLQGHRAFREVAVSKVTRSMLTLAIVTIGLAVGGTVELVVIGMILGNLLMTFLYDAPTVRRIGTGFENPFFTSRYSGVRQFVWRALPLGMVALLIALNANIPRLIVGDVLGTEALGFYASIAYLLVLGNLFINSLMSILMPNFSDESGVRQSPQELRKLARTIFLLTNALGLLLIAGSVVFGEWVLTILYTKEFAAYQNIFILVMVASLFFYNSSVIQTLLTGFRVFRAQTVVLALSVVVNYVACLVLVPRLGMVGANISYLLCAVTQIVLLAPFLWKALMSDEQIEKDIQDTEVAVADTNGGRV